MITDGTFQEFVRVLGAHKKVKRTPLVRFEWEKAGVPGDVGRTLAAVGGWSYGDLRFTNPAELDADRQLLTRFVGDFEAGRSDTWNHAFWNRAWYPLAMSSVEVHAFDPIGCFGGAPGQVVWFDFKGGDTWSVFSSITAWLAALTEGFGSEAKENALFASFTWARANNTVAEVKLPQGLAEQRSPQRFDAGIGAWIELRHADGRRWAIRVRREGYELRIGDGEDAVFRKRTCAEPNAEVRRLVREQKAEGFAAIP